VAPLLATAFLITAFASIGLPGTSGFVGEFLALLGTFERHPVLAGLATTGVIFAAFYMLPMVQTVFFNRLDDEENRKVEDLSRREMTVLAPLLILMILLGVYPKPVLERMEPSVQAVIERVESRGALGVGELGRSAGESGAGVDDGVVAGEDLQVEAPAIAGDGD
jgi:NADH-quinone oxidoreductase subunit M